MGTAQVSVVRSEVSLSGRPGDLVSLTAVAGDVAGVSTDGLRWPLQNAVLEVGETRGTSNELLGESAIVSVKSGVLLAIQPDRYR